MNKYQEALDIINRVAFKQYEDVCYSKTKKSRAMDYESLLNRSANKLQELVDKGTPMKTLCRELQYQVNGKPIVIGLCPTCASFTGSKDIFCSQCGQRLDWSNDNEL